MIKLDKADSQIVLFAKGHFEDVDNNLASVRILVANWLGMDISYVQDVGVIACLKQVLEKCQLEQELLKNLERLVFGDFFTKNMTPVERYVYVVMGILVNMPVMKGEERLVELEPLDPSLFKKEKEQ